METETKEVIHNLAAIEVSKVTMYNIGHTATSLDLVEYVSEFNFLALSLVNIAAMKYPIYVSHISLPSPKEKKKEILKIAQKNHSQPVFSNKHSVV